MVKTEAFLALEVSLSQRLQASLVSITSKLYSEIQKAIEAEDFVQAEKLVGEISLHSLYESNKDYIEYVTNLAMLFGASRVTSTPGTSVVGLGYEKITAQQSMLSFQQMLIQKAEAYLKQTAMQLIAIAKANSGPETIHKANPYHDERGRFTSKDKAVDQDTAVDSLLDSLWGSMDTTTGEIFPVPDSVAVQVRSYSGGNSMYVPETSMSEVFDHVRPLRTTISLYRGIGVGDPVMDAKVGDVISHNRVLSTSTSRIVGGNYATLHSGKTLKIKVEAGSKVAYAGRYSAHQGEDSEHEALLPHTGYLKITKVTPTVVEAIYVPTNVEKEAITTRKANPYHESSVKKQDNPPILRPFASFLNESGKAYLNVVASLHTSRLSAYGFTAEAAALGLDEYQISEQLDTRICPVCAEMHGKKFRVSDARSLLDVALRVTDPDDLKQIQPWPKQNKETLESIKGMSSAELVAKAWHLPPFHPGCRGLLTRVGRVPSLAQIEANQVPEEYTATKDDFSALGLSMSDKQVSTWNKLVGSSPAEVISRLQGRSLDEFLAAVMGSEDKQEEAGIHAMTIAKNINMALTTKGFGAKHTFVQSLRIRADEQSLYLSSLELGAEDQGAGIAKRYMRELVTLARDLGLKSVSLTAGMEVGGYAWAKYGFKPDWQSWKYLKKDIQNFMSKKELFDGVSPETMKVFDAIMKSDDSSYIFLLSDLAEKVKTGIPFGKAALLGRMWHGYLHLEDEESMLRFLAYIGELK